MAESLDNIKVQVLVAALNKNFDEVYSNLNIQSDAIICNQCNKFSHFVKNLDGHQIKCYSFNERGLSINRNNALIRADGDICLLADDDITYIDGYVDIVRKNFIDNPDADVIIFNIKEKNPRRYIIKNKQKINYFNFMRYGSVRIAFKLWKIKINAISFNQCFGAGVEYASFGEDTLFLKYCLDHGLKIYAVPDYIASLNDDRDSTWFNGYTDKYFRDKGRLFYAMSKRFYKLLCLQDALRHRKEYKLSISDTYYKMTQYIN